MPRTPRRDAPGEIHHVWTRGLDRCEIFRNDGDRWDLVDRLSRVLVECGTTCLAWAFLSNHYHLVVKRGQVPLGRAMARINTGYARCFNERHGRSGFLFENRYKSRVVEDDADLLATIRYVLRNPIGHGVVRDPTQLLRYPWTSCSGLLGRRPLHPFESETATLRTFGGERQAARATLRALVMGDRVAAAPTIAGSGRMEPETPPSEGAPDFGRLVQRVCDRFGADPGEVRTGRRTRPASDARAALAWLGALRLGMSGRALARELGCTQSGVSRNLDRGRILVEERRLVELLDPSHETQQLILRPR